MEARRIQVSEWPRVLYLYKVRGTFHFPLDMLRYDACWPGSSEAVSAMAADGGGEVVVELHSYKHPTEDRWKSFGWIVL